MLAGIAGFLVATQGNDPASQPPGASPHDAGMATAKLMATTFSDVNATGQTLKQWQGKVLVVNFWATWCTPCRDEMPGFSRLQDKYTAKNIQFVGIAIDSVDKVKEFQHLVPVNYPLLISDSTVLPIAAELGNAVGGLPFTVIIGRDGTLLQTRLGIWREAALEAILAAQSN